MGKMVAVRNCPAAAIILFGCERPAHLVALHLSRLYGIDVLCLEEGYLGTGYPWVRYAPHLGQIFV